MGDENQTMCAKAAVLWCAQATTNTHLFQHRRDAVHATPRHGGLVCVHGARWEWSGLCLRAPRFAGGL